MSMTYEQITGIIQRYGGMKTLHHIINDAGSIIEVDTIDKDKIEINKDLNCISFPSFDDGVLIMANISLDSIADLRFRLEEVVEEPNQASIEMPEIICKQPEGKLTKETIKNCPGFEGMKKVVDKIIFNAPGIVIGQTPSKPIEEEKVEEDEEPKLENQESHTEQEEHTSSPVPNNKDQVHEQNNSLEENKPVTLPNNDHKEEPEKLEEKVPVPDPEVKEEKLDEKVTDSEHKENKPEEHSLPETDMSNSITSETVKKEEK